MNIYDYGILPSTENLPGIPARVTAVHRQRYEIVCQYGITYARLKAKAYYAGAELFPTTGDFVMIDYISSGDSLILSTLPQTADIHCTIDPLSVGRGLAPALQAPLSGEA